MKGGNESWKRWEISFVRYIPFLITFAEECNKSLLKFETASLKGKIKFAYPQGGESGAVRLILTACSAFQRHGHQAAGMSTDFEVYLTELALPMKLNTNGGK